MELDLKLIAGDFLDATVDKDKEYLFKYFRPHVQQLFVSYYFNFSLLRDRSPKHFIENFIDHTGVYCTQRSIQKWMKKLCDLESLAEEAKVKTDLETLTAIKSGFYRLK